MKGGFISFGDVAGSSSSKGRRSETSKGDDAEMGSIASPAYSGLPGLAAISKRLQKKDAVTRVKALLDLGEELRVHSEESDASATIGFLPFFLFCFERMWTENERKIREELFHCLYLAINNIGKADPRKQALTPYMTGLIGPWWIDLMRKMRQHCIMHEHPQCSNLMFPKGFGNQLKYLGMGIVSKGLLKRQLC